MHYAIQLKIRGTGFTKPPVLPWGAREVQVCPHRPQRLASPAQVFFLGIRGDRMD
jgi:hypothetical protein